MPAAEALGRTAERDPLAGRGRQQRPAPPAGGRDRQAARQRAVSDLPPRRSALDHGDPLPGARRGRQGRGGRHLRGGHHRAQGGRGGAAGVGGAAERDQRRQPGADEHRPRRPTASSCSSTSPISGSSGWRTSTSTASTAPRSTRTRPSATGTTRSWTTGARSPTTRPTLRRVDGTPVPVSVTSRQIVFQGEPAIVTAWADLTALRAAQAEVARSREALHQSEKLTALGRAAGRGGARAQQPAVGGGRLFLDAARDRLRPGDGGAGRRRSTPPPSAARGSCAPSSPWRGRGRRGASRWRWARW